MYDFSLRALDGCLYQMNAPTLSYFLRWVRRFMGVKRLKEVVTHADYIMYSEVKPKKGTPRNRMLWRAKALTW